MSDQLSSEFRNAMRRLTSAVSVISACVDREWYGLTATSVTSVCAEPAALLTCVNKSARIYEPLSRSTNFCINILDVTQVNVSSAFGGRLQGPERFKEGAWSLSEEGAPFLRGAQANIFCDTHQIVTFGTHGIFFGLVTRVALIEGISPLLYEDGKYVRAVALA